MGFVMLWLICGFICMVIAQNKGTGACGGFIVGALLGPLGIILALVVKPNTQAVEYKQLASGEMKKCPFCAELIRADANVCRYCSRDVGVVTVATTTPAAPPRPSVYSTPTPGTTPNRNASSEPLFSKLD
ncbi:MAG: hypothetical protein M3R24_40595 [Chloroflexota bacterium]|nr:hypothetical protein [Chloroflexota bacterium]